jgi:hypothetical protein
MIEDEEMMVLMVVRDLVDLYLMEKEYMHGSYVRLRKVLVKFGNYA